VALAECSLTAPSGRMIGSRIEFGETSIRKDALWFGESQSRIVMTTDDRGLEALKGLASSHAVPLTVLGKTGGDRMTIRQEGRELIDVPLRELERVWHEAIPKRMGGQIHV
jgi:phosphoribosylformylglycinamidine synthase subunit PurL